MTNTLGTTYAYAHNGQGWITSETTISGTDAVAHDPATGRLASDCGPQVEAQAADHCYRWTYDGNGNVASQVADNGQAETYTYGTGTAQPDQLLQIHAPGYPDPDTYFAYDANGDTTAITAPVNGSLSDPRAVNTHLAYDARQRPPHCLTGKVTQGELLPHQ